MVNVTKKIVFMTIVAGVFFFFFHNVELSADNGNPIIKALSEMEKTCRFQQKVEQKKELRKRSITS